jgi:predicted phage tail protein
MGQLRGLSTSYYVNNPLEAIRALTARVAALERALGRSQALQMDAMN